MRALTSAPSRWIHYRNRTRRRRPAAVGVGLIAVGVALGRRRPSASRRRRLPSSAYTPGRRRIGIPVGVYVRGGPHLSGQLRNVASIRRRPARRRTRVPGTHLPGIPRYVPLYADGLAVGLDVLRVPQVRYVSSQADADGQAVGVWTTIWSFAGDVA